MDWVRYLEWRLYLRWLHWCGHQYITFCGNLCIPTKTVKSKPCFDSTILQKIELRIWRTNLGMLTALRTSKSSMISRTLLKKINQITGVNLSKIWILRTVDNCGLAWTSLLTKPAATPIDTSDTTLPDKLNMHGLTAPRQPRHPRLTWMVTSLHLSSMTLMWIVNYRGLMYGNHRAPTRFPRGSSNIVVTNSARCLYF